MSRNLPNPSLVGILFVVSTHSGPQLLYKYPHNLTDRVFSLVPRKHAGTEDGMQHLVRDDKDDDDDDELYEYNEDEDPESGDLLFFDKDGTSRDRSGINVISDTNHSQYYYGTKLELKRTLDEGRALRRATPHKYNHNRLSTEHPKRNEHSQGSKSRRSIRNTDTTQDDNYQKQKGQQEGREKKDKDKEKEKEKDAEEKGDVSEPHSAVDTFSIADDIFGMAPGYLCEMLSPPRQMCNTRYEVTIQDKIFLGLPIHQHADGTWTNARSSKRSQSGRSNSLHFENLTSSTEAQLASTTAQSLTMFHLVFIMNPPATECSYRIDEMFQHVASRTSLGLRLAQQKHNYVGNQMKAIQRAREQECKEVDLDKTLSLCKLIKECYLAISSSRIANLEIDGKQVVCQIPTKYEFDSLPEPSVPYIPRSFLSSSIHSFGMWDRSNIEQQKLDDDFLQESIMCFALLLLAEPHNILQDMNIVTNSPFGKFIMLLHPSESLLKFCSKNSQHFEPSEVKSYALHLIYWKKARAIQPLSSRSVYVASPMASLTTKLFEDIYRFKARFPMSPSLPQFLKLLSPQLKKPQQFASIIPSRDHRASYFEALAWLIRFGYVNQQLTFVWLKIPKNLRVKVEEDMENEDALLKRNKDRVFGEKSQTTDNTSKTMAVQESPHNNDITTTRDTKISNNRNNGSDFDTDADANVNVNSDANTSTNAAIANTAAGLVDARKDSLVNATTETTESQTERLKKQLTLSVVDDEDTIILEPGRASTLERRWINEIISVCKLSHDLIAIFYKLLKFMNGKTPLEFLIIKNEISRLDLKKLLYAIGNYIVSVRHW